MQFLQKFFTRNLKHNSKKGQYTPIILYEYYTKFFILNQYFSALFIKIVYKFSNIFLSILNKKRSTEISSLYSDRS